MAKLEANAARACNLLKAMANPARLMVLCQIADGEKSVNELAQAVGLSQSGLSQHLTVLRSRNLVTTRRAGQTIYYSLASAEAAFSDASWKFRLPTHYVLNPHNRGNGKRNDTTKHL